MSVLVSAPPSPPSERDLIEVALKLLDGRSDPNQACACVGCQKVLNLAIKFCEIFGDPKGMRQSLEENLRRVTAKP